MDTSNDIKLREYRIKKKTKQKKTEMESSGVKYEEQQKRSINCVAPAVNHAW